MATAAGSSSLVGAWNAIANVIAQLARFLQQKSPQSFVLFHVSATSRVAFSLSLLYLVSGLALSTRSSSIIHSHISEFPYTTIQ